jgi:ABC-2 type transport system ATP-binding protein
MGPDVPVTPTSAISVTGVRRSFGEIHAVRDATLEVAAGRVTGLIGPNGSGKTTLLLMLASLLAPDAGTIRIGGADPVADPHAARRVFGWMPDALGAWGALTARETLVTTGRLYDLDPRSAAARAEQLLHLVDLANLAASPARVLSRGQKQRLGLARALVHDPSVLLLDEPASGLDPDARAGLRVLLRRFAAEGRAVLVSSHILSELDEVADDAVFLLDGATVPAERVAAAAARGRAWRVRLAGAGPEASLPLVATALGRDPAQLTRERQVVLAAFASDDDAAAGLVALVAAGLRVAEFAPATGDLEHAFLDLRQGGAR